MSANALVTYISELLEYAELLGIKSASALGVAGELDAQSSILLYDFCYSVLSFLTREENQSELMVHFQIVEERYRLLFISEADFSAFQPSQELLEKLEACDGLISNKNLDEAYSLQLEIPLRKEVFPC